MCALKRKLRCVVVERLGRAPSNLVVARVAFFAKSPLMLIVPPMAIETESGRFAKLDALVMALVAPGRLVGARKREICEGVIERLPIELDNICVFPFVIGVAIFALLFRCIGLAPMETPACQPVRCDVLMACKTQIALRLPGKRYVTLKALSFELGMPFDERPWRDELLEHVL